MNFLWKNIETFKDHFFLSSDGIFNALEWIFMKKYWNFQRSFFSWFRCDIQCTCRNFHEKILKLSKIIFFLVQMSYSMHLNEFSWKNIETSKIIFFLVQMWYSMHLQEFSWQNIETFKDHYFLSSDVIFNALAWIFMKKYWNFQRSFFS